MQRSGSRVCFVTGKGGVGKTTVATSLALAEVDRGHRVLLAEVRGQDRVAALLGLPTVGPDLRQAEERLFVVDMDPRAAIREYVLLTLRFEALYRAVFENRTVQRLLRMVPSLAELVMLGKIWHHAEEEEEERPRFDVVVVDAPATGHLLGMLQAPAMVQRMVPPGPLRDITRNLQDLLCDASRTTLHAVTTPEEMPISEALEIERVAQQVLHMRVGALVINQRLEPLPAGMLQAIAKHAPAEVQDPLSRLTAREKKRQAGESYLQRWSEARLHEAVSLPRLRDEPIGREGLSNLAERLSSIVPAEDSQ